MFSLGEVLLIVHLGPVVESPISVTPRRKYSFRETKHFKRYTLSVSFNIEMYFLCKKCFNKPNVNVNVIL